MLSTSLKTAVRSIHTSRVSYGLFDFFSKSTTSTPKQPKPEKTSKVMSKLEQEKQPVVAKNLRVVGEPVDNSWEEENNGFVVNAWPIKTVKPELTMEQVAKAFETHALGHTSLEDLGVRFDLIKSLTKELGVSVPDSRIASLGSVSDLRNYYEHHVVGYKFNEKEPDAIYLDPKDFEGTNIKLVDASEIRKQQKQTREELLRKAREVEQQRQDALLQSA